MRLGILLSHPVQYYAYWFRHLASRGDVEVFYMHRQTAAGQAAAGFGVAFEWDVPLLEGYPHRFLENVSRAPSVRGFGGCDVPEIYEVLARERFDAFLVFGWNRKGALQAVDACRKAGVPVLMRGDSQLRTRRSALRSAAKYPLYRMLLPRVDGHLYVGARNREYLAHYGVPEDRLFYAPHFVDNDFFARKAAEARACGRAAALRRELGIPEEAFVALFAGKFIEKKRPGDVVRAVGQLAEDGGTSRVDVHALMVGDGPLAPELERLAASSGAPVHFAGFRNQTELPACYAAADVLVLPSDGQETWGLVANEAMACGLPVVVGESAGCAPDLVQQGATGFAYPTGDVDALARRLVDAQELAACEPARMQRAIAEKMKQHSVETATAGLEAALDAVTAPAARPQASGVPLTAPSTAPLAAPLPTAPRPTAFDKYDAMGAYHWDEADPRSRQFNPPLVARYELVARTIRGAGLGSVLDVGCGDGYLLSLVAPHVGRAVGVDSEAAGVAHARRRLADFENVHVQQGDGYGLGFADGSFDAVLLTDVIEHLTDPDRCLEEVRRVLRPGGRLVLTTPKFRPDRQWDERHVQEFTPEALRERLEPVFDGVEMTYFWPSAWSSFYATRVGWRLTKKLARLSNPFLRSGAEPEKFGQIMAVCRVRSESPEAS